MIKVLLQNHKETPMGGVETYFQMLVPALKEREIQVTVLYTNEPGKKNCIEKGISKYYLPGIGLTSIKKLIRQIPAIIRDFIKLTFFLRKEKFDIIYLQNIHLTPIFWFFRKKTKIIQFIHDYCYICPNLRRLTYKDRNICKNIVGIKCYKKCLNLFSILDFFYFIVTVINKNIARQFNHHIVASEHMKNVLNKACFDSKKVSVNFLFTNNYSQKGVYNLRKVLYAGRFSYEKGVEYLIDALSLIKTSYYATFCGKGIEKEYLMKLCIDKNISKNVSFDYANGLSELDKYYRECTVVVIPSIWDEPFGLVGLEAMMQGKPVIATNTGAIPEWLIDGLNGFLVNPKDSKMLAGKIEYLLNNPSIAEEIGENGRKFVKEKYSIDKHIDKLIEVFNMLL